MVEEVGSVLQALQRVCVLVCLFVVSERLKAETSYFIGKAPEVLNGTAERGNQQKLGWVFLIDSRNRLRATVADKSGMFYSGEEAPAGEGGNLLLIR